MNTELKEEILELYERLRKEDNSKADRLERWRNLEPQSAELIALIIRGQKSKKVLELGTSNGFSTIWFADAVKGTGGKVTSIEIEPSRTISAKENLVKYGLAEYVELVTADAKDFLYHALPVYDTLFLDAERPYYTEYWPDLKRLLERDGALLIVDNVISHESEIKHFLHAIKDTPGLISTTVGVGAGLLLVTKDLQSIG